MKFDKKFMQLGFIQGDGGLGRLKSDAHKGMEVNIGIYDDDILPLFNLKRESNERKYYLNGFNDICRQLKFSSEQLPNRPLPLTFNNWSDNEQISFMRGLYSANGSFIKNGRISFKTTCRELSEQLRGFLQSLDYNPYITTNKSKKVVFKNGEYICKESYDVNIGRQLEVKRFYNEIGFIHDYKMESIKEYLTRKELL